MSKLPRKVKNGIFSYVGNNIDSNIIASDCNQEELTIKAPNLRTSKI